MSTKQAKQNEHSHEMQNQTGLLFKWVFPIYSHEYIKIFPVILMMLSALLVYTLYRDIKDAMVFGEERQSLITVQWCKVLVMIVALPVATLFMKLANVVSRDFIFYQTVFFFASYFMVNTFLLYPGRAVIHTRSISAIRYIDENYDTWDKRLMPIAGLFLFPINSLHYLASELWGTISVSFLLWGYVNSITPREAAKRYYAVLGLGAQFGPLLAGEAINWIVHGKNGVDAFLQSLIHINTLSLVFMILFVLGYAFMQMYVMKLDRFASPNKNKKSKSKGKMGIIASIKYCVGNPYVLALGGLVFAYGWCMVVGEMSYKDVMKLETEGDQNRYSNMKGYESKASAILAMFLMTFVSHNVIRLFGWKVTALLAPAICCVTAGLFYGSVLFATTYEHDDIAGDFVAIKPASTIGMWLGLFFAVATKGTKYAAFDPAKELAYLPLTSEEKYKSKAAVDIVGARFGKGGAALFNIFVLNWFLGKEKTFEKHTQLFAVTAVIAMMFIWVGSTLYLANAIKKKEYEKELKSQMNKQIQVQVGSTNQINQERDGETNQTLQ